MEFKTEVQVLKVMRKESKAGKPYNKVIIGLPGIFEKASLFLPEVFVPDILEGKRYVLRLGITFRNWKPDVFIKGIEREVN
jgi:hypothetical protein